MGPLGPWEGVFNCGVVSSAPSASPLVPNCPAREGSGLSDWAVVKIP